MITKIPLRIARTLLPINYSGLRLYIPESIIEKSSYLFKIRSFISTYWKRNDIWNYKFKEYVIKFRLDRN